METTIFFQVLLNGLQLGMIYVLLALGLTVVFSIMHIINFAHGEVYMLGAFAVFYTTSHLFIPYWAAFFISMVLVGLIGIVIEKAVFRPLRGKELPSLIVSLGLVMLLQSGALLLFGEEDKAIPSAVRGVFRLGGIVFSKERLVIIGIAVILIIGLYIFLYWFKAGQAMRAIAQDPEAAALQGISIDYTSSLGFGLGCTLAAAAGALTAPVFYIEPFMGGMPVMKSFCVLILGGLGSVTGAVAGGLILGILESFSKTFVGTIADMFGFILLILVLMFKPTGLFGHD